jgi:P-type Mg2+ transporter
MVYGRVFLAWEITNFSLLTQVLIVIMLRTQHIPLIQSRPSRVMAVALVCIACVGVSLPYIPGLSTVLQMQHPHPMFYAFLVGILVGYMVLVQAVKTVYRRIYHEWL